MFFPSVGVNNLQIKYVNRALRVSGLRSSAIAGVKLNDFITNKAVIMHSDQTVYQIDEIKRKVLDVNTVSFKVFGLRKMAAMSFI